MIVYDKYSFNTSREIDPNGFLRVEMSNITKSQIRPYLGREIPGYKDFNLDPNKIYNVLCPEEELKKAAKTFNNLPLTREHIEVDVEDVPKDKIVGSLGDHAKVDGGYLKNNLIIYDKKDIDLVMSGKKKELSCGYRYTPVRESGEYEGQHYDFKMTDIVGNHVALVKQGRAGRDVMVADTSKGLLETIKEKIMAVFDNDLVADAEEKKDDDVEWITVKGNHIPVGKGQSKEEAVKSFIESKKDGKSEKGTAKLSEEDVKALKSQAKEMASKDYDAGEPKSEKELRDFFESYSDDEEEWAYFKDAYRKEINKNKELEESDNETSEQNEKEEYSETMTEKEAKENGYIKEESSKKSDGEKVKEFIETAKGKYNEESDKDWLKNKIEEADVDGNKNKKLISFLKNEADIREGDSMRWKGKEHTLIDIDVGEETAVLEDDDGNRKTVDLESLMEVNYEEGYNLYTNEEDGVKAEKITEQEARDLWAGHYHEQKFKQYGDFDSWFKEVQKFDDIYDWYYNTKDKTTNDSDISKQEKVGVVMKEFKKGELKSGSGKKVTDPKQAIAIALSEADKVAKDAIPEKAGKPEKAGEENALQQGEKKMAEEVKEEVKTEKKVETTPAEEKPVEDACSKDEEVKKKKSEEEVIEDEKEKDLKGKEKKAFAEGVDYGEKKEKEEPKKLDSEHESEGAKKADEEEKKEKMAKDSALVTDADALRAEGRAQAMEDYKAREVARKSVRSIVGDVDVFAFDSAEDIYKFACKEAGMNLNEIASYKDAFLGLQAGKKARLAMDASPISGSNEECLKNIRLA